MLVFGTIGIEIGVDNVIASIFKIQERRGSFLKIKEV